MPRSRKTEPVKSKDPAKAPSIRGEKRVKGTDATVGVNKPNRTPKAKRPVMPQTLDGRKQFTGTDDPRRA